MNNQLDISSKVIYQYIKDKNGNLIGCVAAVGPGQVGWSRCNTKAGDVFNKKRALQIAIGRAIKNNPYSTSTVPFDIQPVYLHFQVDRSMRYYKSNINYNF